MSVQGAAEGQSFVNDVNNGGGAEANETVMQEVKKPGLEGGGEVVKQENSGIAHMSFAELTKKVEDDKAEEAKKPLSMPMSH
jgi:hypothetical protein